MNKNLGPGAGNYAGVALTRADALTQYTDVASGTVTYVGESEPGTATSAAGWRIQRKTTSGSLTKVEWADGNGRFDNVWDNRASLNYF